MKPASNATILPTVTIAAISGRVWVYLPGEPSIGAFVDETELVAVLRGMIEKEKKNV